MICDSTVSEKSSRIWSIHYVVKSPTKHKCFYNYVYVSVVIVDTFTAEPPPMCA